MSFFDFQSKKAAFAEVYSLRDEDAKGRLISLGSTLMTAFYNVFITGIFYTGFLSMYGMSITNVGIISFIPLFASCFSVFSSVILEKFKRRKPILIAAKIFFYSMYILATTLMPQFVHDPQARLMWFIIILFVAYAVYALFQPGFTTWFYAFYPSDNRLRTRYLALNQVFGSLMSSLMLLLSSLITDALSGTPHQNSLILGFRYLAFALVLVDVAMQARAVEHPYPEGPKIRFAQVFTLPFRYKKFMMCLGLMFFWSFLSNICADMWNFHLLTHLHFSYTLITAMSIAYTVTLVLFSGFWQKVVRRYSWVKTYGVGLLLWMPTEIGFFLMSADRAYLYIPLCMIQNVLNVGINLAYANVLYLNLPKENSTAHIAFYSIGCNVFAVLGVLVGTKISSAGGDVPFMFMGMEAYSVQFTCLVRAVGFLILGLLTAIGWKKFTPQAEIEEVEANDRADRKMRKLLKKA